MSILKQPFYKKTLHGAICTFGIQRQHNKFFEEIAELQKAVANGLNGKLNKRNMAEELADVYIMLEQIKLMYAIPDAEVEENIQYKIHRLNDTIIETTQKLTRTEGPGNGI